MAIVVIAITIIRLLKKTRLCNFIYCSNGQTQTNILSQTIQEIDRTATELQQLNSTISKQATTTDRIQKDVDTIYCNVTAQQAPLDLLNKYTLENLQTIVDTVHQLVYIAQNPQDNTQTLVQKTTKFQETTLTNIHLITELLRRNSRWLPIIQEAIQRINTILDELTTIDETQAVQTSHLQHMRKLEDNLPQAEQDISFNPEEQEEEEHQDMNKTGVATLVAPWEYLPCG